MAYKCPECGYTAEEAGDCPTCDVPMVEEGAGESFGEEGKEEAV